MIDPQTRGKGRRRERFPKDSQFLVFPFFSLLPLSSWPALTFPFRAKGDGRKGIRERKERLARKKISCNGYSRPARAFTFPFFPCLRPDGSLPLVGQKAKGEREEGRVGREEW